MIELMNVSKEYKRKFYALKENTLSFPSKSFNVLIGKSGSGKTTMLNIIGGLDMPSSGELFVDGKKIDKKTVDAYRNTEVGYVFQDKNLVASLSLKENLNLAFNLCGRKMNEEDVKRVLTDVNLPNGEESIDELLQKKPYQLSEGQTQRFTIARALIKNPSILLFDEPTSALDEENAYNILQLLKDLAKTKTVIVSSHDKNLFVDAADQVIELEFGKATVSKPYDKDQFEEVDSKREHKKGFFSFSETLKLALMNLKNKKIRLVTSLIVSVIAAGLFGVTFLFYTCNTTSVLLHTQIDNHHLGATITLRERIGVTSDGEVLSQSCPFSDEQIEKIAEHTNGNYALIGNTTYSFLSEKIPYETKNHYVRGYLYYNGLAGKAIEAEPAKAEEILGLTRYSGLLEETENRFPETYDEIAISSIQAELYAKEGLMTKSSSGQISIYKPSRVDDLIGYTFPASSSTAMRTLTISGIFSTDDDMSDFWIPLLDLSDEEIQAREDYEIINNKYSSYSIAQAFFVKAGFSESRYPAIENPSRFYIRLTGNYDADYKFLTSFDSWNVYLNYLNSYTGFAYLVSTVTSGQFSLLLWCAIIILLLISFATSLGLFYGNIQSMEKELGIFRAMGASKMAISAIILAQASTISLFEYLITLIGLFVFAAVVNQRVIISLLSVNFPTMALLFLLLVVLALAISLVSSRRALTTKPINIIKEK